MWCAQCALVTIQKAAYWEGPPRQAHAWCSGKVSTGQTQITHNNEYAILGVACCTPLCCPYPCVCVCVCAHPSRFRRVGWRPRSGLPGHSIPSMTGTAQLTTDFLRRPEGTCAEDWSAAPWETICGFATPSKLAPTPGQITKTSKQPK